jgi:hypothetical protein
VRDIGPKVLAFAMVVALYFFIATGFGACGPEAQKLTVGCIQDTRDWDCHYHIHHH